MKSSASSMQIRTHVLVPSKAFIFWRRNLFCRVTYKRAYKLADTVGTGSLSQG